MVTFEFDTKSEGNIKRTGRAYQSNIACKRRICYCKRITLTPHLDLLVGGPLVRERLSAGATVASIEAEWQQGLAEFEPERLASLLY